MGSKNPATRKRQRRRQKERARQQRHESFVKGRATWMLKTPYMSERFEYRSCVRKKRYASEEAAIHACISTSRYGMSNLRWYACGFCGGWHITSAPLHDWN